jgi:hypothetical protein
VLRLLAAEGMVSPGLLSLDGTKLAGNAAQKADRTLPQIGKILAAAAGKRRGRRPAGEPRANRAGTGPRAGTTDPDVRVMPNQKGLSRRVQRLGRRHRTAGDRGRDAVPAPGRPHPAAPLAGHLPRAADPGRIRPEPRTVLADPG